MVKQVLAIGQTFIMKKSLFQKKETSLYTKRIRKYANSKKVNLTPEQDQFIEEILKLENQDGNLNYNNYDFTTTAWLQMDDEIFKVPFLFKLWYGLLNGVEWCIIFSIIILFLIIRNYII